MRNDETDERRLRSEEIFILEKDEGVSVDTSCESEL
jgi:hypothetical protein